MIPTPTPNPAQPTPVTPRPAPGFGSASDASAPDFDAVFARLAPIPALLPPDAPMPAPDTAAEAAADAPAISDDDQPNDPPPSVPHWATPALPPADNVTKNAENAENATDLRAPRLAHPAPHVSAAAPDSPILQRQDNRLTNPSSLAAAPFLPPTGGHAAERAAQPAAPTSRPVAESKSPLGSTVAANPIQDPPAAATTDNGILTSAEPAPRRKDVTGIEPPLRPTAPRVPRGQSLLAQPAIPTDQQPFPMQPPDRVIPLPTGAPSQSLIAPPKAAGRSTPLSSVETDPNMARTPHAAQGQPGLLAPPTTPTPPDPARPAPRMGRSDLPDPKPDLSPRPRPADPAPRGPATPAVPSTLLDAPLTAAGANPFTARSPDTTQSSPFGATPPRRADPINRPDIGLADPSARPITSIRAEEADADLPGPALPATKPLAPPQARPVPRSDMGFTATSHLTEPDNPQHPAPAGDLGPIPKAGAQADSGSPVPLPIGTPPLPSLGRSPYRPQDPASAQDQSASTVPNLAKPALAKPAQADFATDPVRSAVAAPPAPSPLANPPVTSRLALLPQDRAAPATSTTPPRALDEAAAAPIRIAATRPPEMILPQPWPDPFAATRNAQHQPEAAPSANPTVPVPSSRLLDAPALPMPAKPGPQTPKNVSDKADLPRASVRSGAATATPLRPQKEIVPVPTAIPSPPPPPAAPQPSPTVAPADPRPALPPYHPKPEQADGPTPARLQEPAPRTPAPTDSRTDAALDTALSARPAEITAAHLDPARMADAPDAASQAHGIDRQNPPAGKPDLPPNLPPMAGPPLTVDPSSAVPAAEMAARQASLTKPDFSGRPSATLLPPEDRPVASDPRPTPVPDFVTHQVLPRIGAPGVVSVTLAPAELGTLQFEVTLKGDVLHLHLLVEQPATLDLLRRQGDQLLAELRQAGFAQASLSFGSTDGQSGQNARSGDPPPAPHRPSGADPAPTGRSDPTPRPTTPTGSLDLRL